MERVCIVVVFVILAWFFNIQGQEQQGICPKNWFKLNNESCYHIFNSPLNWEAAKSACEELGSTLVMVKSQAEQEALSPRIISERVWIGMHRYNGTSPWFWVDGTQVTYTNWGSGEPNNLDNELCVMIWPPSFPFKWKWNNQRCAIAYHYVCEVSGIHGINLNASKTVLKVGSAIEISCTVIGGLINPYITWFKGSEMIVLSHRRNITIDERQSRLTITNATAKDEGVYHCYTSTGQQNISDSVTIWVDPPVLLIKPRVMTKRVGEQAIFICNVSSGSSTVTNVSLVEVTEVNSKSSKLDKHQQKFVDSILSSYHQVSFSIINLQIPEGTKIQVRQFICEVKYRDHTVRSELADLIILPPSPEQLDPSIKCPREISGGVEWSATAGGGGSIKPCPNGARGTATRICTNKGMWLNANFTGCSSDTFIKLADAMKAIVAGLETNLTAQDVLWELSIATQSIQNNPSRPLQIYGGDLVIAVDILVEISIDSKNVTSRDDFKNFAHVASNLLETTNSRTWKELKKAGKDRSRSLVKAMDRYGLAVAATLHGSTKPIVARTKNLLMRIDRVKKDSPCLKISYSQSSIYLPSQAFSSSQDSSVVTIIFLTLHNVLSLPAAKTIQNNSGRHLSPNTSVISATVKPRPPDVFNKPVKIVLRNTKVNSYMPPQGNCVFWRPEESSIWNSTGCRRVPSKSDTAMTTCECDHLTVFAALIDPFGPPTKESHKEALEIISTVGCSISLVAVVITIIVLSLFSRPLKAGVKVLINLCAAIAITCVLVIFEGLARSSKVGCPVVAAFLQYFLLALFSWMLCEGISLYLKVVKPLEYGLAIEEKMKSFYLFGWGFPAIIVSISLAVTQTNGYGSKSACWLDIKNGLIWTFIAPALFVILVNTTVLIQVMREITKKVTRKVENKTQSVKLRAGVRASAALLPLLGITWLFGLLGFSYDTIVFKYIFAIFNSLQGLMVFIFHCALNDKIKQALIKGKKEHQVNRGTIKRPNRDEYEEGVPQ